MILLNINRGQGFVHTGAEYNLWKEITVAVFYHIHYTKHIKLSQNCQQKY